jgi:hypothetical protein
MYARMVVGFSTRARLRTVAIASSVIGSKVSGTLSLEREFCSNVVGWRSLAAQLPDPRDLASWVNEMVS